MLWEQCVAHTHTAHAGHASTLRSCQTWKWITMKDLKATGSYLTNLKVNGFSISLHPRLISVTGIGIVNSATCMPAVHVGPRTAHPLHQSRSVNKPSPLLQLFYSFIVKNCILYFFTKLHLNNFLITLAFKSHLFSHACQFKVLVNRSISSMWGPSICHLHQFVLE